MKLAKSPCSSFPDCIQRLPAADVNSPVGDHRRSGDVVGEVVLCELLEFRPSLDDGDDAVASSQIHLAVGVNRRSAIPGAMEFFLVLLRASRRLEASQESPP